jgi:hypothetical protein
MVALEVMVLWPRGVGGPAATSEAGLWPVFAIVLGDRDAPAEPDVQPLFDLLYSPEYPGRFTVVEGRCQWSLLDPRHALLKLAVHATAPIRFDANILLPAGPVLGILDVLARGATIAITTQRHANRLARLVDIRHALESLVLLCCRPSRELDELADALTRTQAAEQPVT